MTPGRIEGGDTGDVACDHYRRYREDVRAHGASWAFRLPIELAWARVLPDGTGAVNRPGLEFYVGWSISCSSAGHRAHASRSIIGTCPRRSTTGAAGLIRTAPGGLPSYAARGLPRPRGSRAALGHAQRALGGGGRGVLVSARTPRPSKRLRGPPWSPTICSDAHAAAVQVFRTEARRQIGLVVNLEPKEPARTDSDGPRRGGPESTPT